MITLYHYYLCSSSRYIRLILEEHKIPYQTQLENYWKPQKDFLQLNPAGHLPVLINEENFPFIGANACVEYIRDLKLRPDLFVDDYREKAEINRLVHWFDVVFKKEVFDPIIYEKVFSRIVDNITPNSENIRAALNNLDFHIQYLNYLLNGKKYFIKEEVTYLDFLAVANFSVLDYLGLLNLNSYKNIREWYFKIKSRPSFKILLKDQIVGLNAHENYQNIDV
jgi:glutathione S-transferase